MRNSLFNLQLVEDEGVIVKGNLDTLVLKDQIWLMIIESKRVTYLIRVFRTQMNADVFVGLWWGFLGFKF